MGALAVALGIGTAVATGLGAGSAYAGTDSSDSASSSSADTDSSSAVDAQDADESAPETSASEDDSESSAAGSSAGSDDPEAAQAGEDDTDSEDLEAIVDGDDADDGSSVDEAGGETGQAGDSSDELADDPAAEETASSPTDSGTDEQVVDADVDADEDAPSDGGARAADTAETAGGSGSEVGADEVSEGADDQLAAADEVEALDGTSTASDTAPEAVAGTGSADATMDAAELSSVAETDTAAPSDVQDVSGPGAWVTALLAPFVAPGPLAPAQPPMLLVALAYVGRQIQRTFFNSTPIANDQTELVDPDLGNPIILDATDVNDDTLTYKVAARGEAGGPSHGNVYLDQSTGSVVYVADEGFVGTDTFNYTASDKAAGFRLYGLASTVRALLSGTSVYEDTATVTVVVAGGGVPTAVDDLFRTDEDTPVGGNVLLNDTGLGDGVTAALASGPGNGTVDLVADGSFEYTPNADFNGTDTFGYTVTTAAGEAVSATVTVTIAPVNDAPVAVDDAVVTAVNIPVAGNVLSNDSDPDGDLLTAALVSGPANGGLMFNADGTFQYAPDADFAGSDAFVYSIADPNGETRTATVTVTVTPATDAPTAVDDVVDTDEDTEAAGNVLLNDSGADGPLIAALIEGPANGTVQLFADGIFQYMPDADFNGADTFTYTVLDADGDSDTATVTVNVAPVNDAPTATDDAAATTEDSAVVGNVLLNDSDIESGPLTAALVSGPTGGMVSLAADGTFLYMPDADFNGTDSFEYEVADGGGLTARATVVIEVTAVNDGPTAVNDDVATAEDTAVTGDVLANDLDPDGDPLTATLMLGPRNGTLTLNTDGTFQYTPNPDFHGLDAFSYAVADPAGETATATVIIDITPVNDAPVARPDTVETFEDVPVGGNVLTNDFDVDGDDLTVALDSDPLNGVVNIDDLGNFQYTPNADFFGSDSFTYSLTDSAGEKAIATVVIDIAGVNDAPIALDDDVVTQSGVAVSGNVLDNDSDPDGDGELTVVLDEPPVNGFVDLNPDGSFTYVSFDGFVGIDTFAYTVRDAEDMSASALVTIDVTAVIDAPVAVDDAVTANIGETVLISPLGNDSSPAALALTVVVLSEPASGSLMVDPDDNNVFLYTVGPGFTGTDSFDYVAVDSRGVESNVATVTITAADAPIARDDSVTTEQGVPVSFDVLRNDASPVGVELTALPATEPAYGELTVNADGTFQYAPVDTFSGTDSFTYIAMDANGVQSNVATVTITVTPIDVGPTVRDDTASTTEGQLVVIEVLANDTVDADVAVSIDRLPEFGEVVENPNGIVGALGYTPTDGFVGVDSFVYAVIDADGNQIGLGTVTVTVDPVEGAVRDDTAVTTAGQLVVIEVLANDTVGTDATVSVTRLPENGEVIADPAGIVGALGYTPADGFVGVDSFEYSVVIAGDTIGIATVTITVMAADNTPIANDDAVSINEGEVAVIAVLENDLSPVGDALSALLVSSPSNGTLAFDPADPDGTFQYAPEAGFTGVDSFQYQVVDANGVEGNIATVSITVTSANALIANDDFAATTAGEPVTIDVLANDTIADPDAVSLTIVGTGTTAGGNEVSLNADGTVVFVPVADFLGEDSFQYVIVDADSLVSEATVTVTVSDAVPADGDVVPADGDAAATDL